METIKEIIMFLSQFLIVIIPLIIMAVFVLLLKFLTNISDDEKYANNYNNKLDNNNYSYADSKINKEFNTKINLNNFSIEELEECLEKKKVMKLEDILEELEITKKEVVKLKEEKNNIEEAIVSIPEDTGKKEDIIYPEIEEIILSNIDDKETKLMELINDQFERFKFRLKYIKTVKQLDKLKEEYEKFKKYKKHAKKLFEEFDKKLKKKTNEIIKYIPNIGVTTSIINDKNKKDIKTEQKEKISPEINDKSINKEEKIKKLKKVNKQIKINENKIELLEVSLLSTYSITQTIKYRRKENNKKQPKSKRVEVKPKVESKVVKQKLRTIQNTKLPKGKTEIFNKPKGKTVLSRVGEFVKQVVILPITIIRLERLQRLEKERQKRQLIEMEMEHLKKVRSKLNKKEINHRVIELNKKKEEIKKLNIEKTKVLKKKAENKKKKEKITI